MRFPTLDHIDHGILSLLQENARQNTNAAISEHVNVSASTIGKPISRMQDEGIIKGYQPIIDYEKAGFPIQVLFICTAGITERQDFIEETVGLDGVVNVRELMTGKGNVHILVVGSSNDDITRIAHRFDDIGYTVTDEILLRGEYYQPSVQFQSTSSND
jgi:DNA-binding Lrp family transcriptional regulator